MEVFGSGIIGVYLIMALLMVLMQASIKIIEYFERWNNKTASEEPQP